MDAVTEGMSSAASAIADAVTGTTVKCPRRRKTSKKAASRGRTMTKRGKAKRSAGGRKSASATRRKATRKSAAKRRPSTRRTGSAAATRRAHERLQLPRQPASLHKRSEAPRKLAPPKLVEVQPSAAHAEGGVEHQTERERVLRHRDPLRGERSPLRAAEPSRIALSIGKRRALNGSKLMRAMLPSGEQCTTWKEVLTCIGTA
jgi:hypothetical protein